MKIFSPFPHFSGYSVRNIEVIAIHKQLGLTRKQAQVYALRFEGRTQVEVATILKMRQSRVSECEARAKARNPRLPAISDGRRHRTYPMSAYSSEFGNGLANILGLN